jgi:hypothetical protein
MLEAQKLADQTMGFSAWGPWRFLPLSLALLILGWCVSLNLGVHGWHTETKPDPRQLQQQQLGDALQALTQVLNDDRVINDTLAAEVKTHQKVLAAYLASQPVPSAPDAPVDPTSYAGRLQAIVNELPTVASAPDLITQQKRLFDELMLVRPALAAKRYPDGSAARGFQWACLGWLDARKSAWDRGEANWQSLEEGKPLWQSMMGQLEAFTLDLGSNEEGARKKAAKDLRDFLMGQSRLDAFKQADALLTQVRGVKERLAAALTQLPPPPPLEVTPAQLWQRLKFSGSVTEGLEWLLAANAVLVLMLAFEFWAHRKGMRRLADQWSNWSLRQEVSIRKTSPGLRGVQQSMAKMSDDLDMLADRFLMAAQAIPAQVAQNQPETPWLGVRKLQQDIQQDVQLIREKLLQFHVQFSQGGSHENLTYDLAYLVQGLESVEAMISTLMQQLDLMGKQPWDQDVMALPVLSEQWRVQVLAFKRQLKAMRKEIEEVEGLIDRAAEKVPHDLRFEDLNGYDASGRRIESSA